jgi:U3 small nucleolar RNA-associated protein 7
MWSPNVQEPLVKILCHRSAIKSLAISHNGLYMITSGLDHLLNIWDLRTYKQLKSVKLSAGASSVSFSQKNLIAASLRNQVLVLNNNLIEETCKKPSEDIVTTFDEKRHIYLKNRLNNSSIQNMQFCPFEDVLCIGHGAGITSLLVPGKIFLFCYFILKLSYNF